MNIRKGTLLDFYTIWSLRNDSDVRRVSNNKNFISLSDHTVWFRKKIKNKNCKLFIIEKGIPIGMVRYDIRYKKATINIILSSAYHHLGIASRALQKTMEMVGNYTFIAKVKKKNNDSVALFMRNGFEFFGEERCKTAGITYEFRKKINGKTLKGADL